MNVHTCMLYTFLQYLIVFAIDEGQFEAVFGGVHDQSSGLDISVQTVDCSPSHQSDVDWQIQGPDDPIVTEEEGGGKREGGESERNKANTKDQEA